MPAMAGTGIVLSARYLEHDTGPHHPECAERIRVLSDRLLGQESSALELIEPNLIGPSLVERVHTREYINKFRYACDHQAGFLDTPECPVCPRSYEIACLSAGGVVTAVDAVMAGRIKNAFCAVRPPGHHAERAHAMGFCFFNNIAIAAEHLRADHGINRVAILDWDVHHGNGTQHHFESNAQVLYCSIHQHPYTLYPGTGFEWEIGVGAAKGTTLNVPMMPGSGDDEYHRAFEEQILPTISGFNPGFILISAGFDAHRDDPLAHIMLNTRAFEWMTRQMVTIADSLCKGRMVSVLEGGYNFEALADSVETHVAVLTGSNNNS